MSTTDVRVWDGQNWVSVSGPEGASVKAATADEYNVPNKEDGSLGDAVADVTAVPDENGDKTLNFNFGIPVGLPGGDGTSATVSVNSATTTTVDHTQDATVNVSDAAPSDPNDLKLDFGFQIPKGEPGTGIVIKGSVPNEAALPPAAAYPGDPGDLYIVEVNDNGDKGHGFVFNNDPKAWSDVGQIKGEDGQDGCDPNLTVGSVTTTEVECGTPATAGVQRNAGSTNCNPVFDFAFGIPAPSTVSIQAGVGVTDLCGDAESATASFTETSGDACNPSYKLDLQIPRVKVSKGDTQPSGSPCTGDWWIVTDA